ncbi:hypothetical protein JCM6882_008212 [Rhodosporidiobolus microsporus]
MSRKLSPDGKRLRAIIISTPFLVASSILLYKRLVLGEEQRHLPRPHPTRDGTGLTKKDEDGFGAMPDAVQRRIRELEEQQKRR